MYQLNITTLQWRRLSLSLPPRKFHTMVIINETLLMIMGGIDDLKNRVATVTVIDLTSDKVREAASLPEPLQLHGSAAYGNLVWLYGGSLANGTRQNETFVLSFSEEQFQQLPKGDDKLGLKLGLGIGLSVLALIVIVGIVAAVLMKKYHLIVISKENLGKDEWTS